VLIERSLLSTCSLSRTRGCALPVFGGTVVLFGSVDPAGVNRSAWCWSDERHHGVEGERSRMA
jgi:hypothetical protein